MKHMKKLLSLILALVMIMSCIPAVSAAEPGCPSAEFSDVPANGHWAHNGIDYMIGNGYMNGTSTYAKVFSPNMTTSRAMIVQILHKLEGQPAASGEMKFADTVKGDWYYNAVLWAVQNGIANGTSETTFVPNGNVTREQIATFLYKHSKETAPDTDLSLGIYPDASKVSNWAKSAMAWAVNKGIITGKSQNSYAYLDPQGPATRAEVATMCYRYIAEPAIRSGLVGISMPTKDLLRWAQDGDIMAQRLKAIGYSVDLQYADNDVAMQIAQIANMIDNGAKVIVIAAIDGEALDAVLQQAKAHGVAVISYDRLIMYSDAVTYYATFDNYLVGVMQGQYIVDMLDLANAAEGTSYNIEFVTGDPGDNNINFYYDGAMSVLKEYIDSGVLVCQSGQINKFDVTTEWWDANKAYERFVNILSTYYKNKPLHAVLASNDSTAQGVATALSSSYDNTVYPVLTGMDCDLVSMLNMLDGKQAMSVFKDTRDLASKTIKMVDAIMQGSEPPINDTDTYDNGTGIIPSYLCPPKVCNLDNYYEILIESGYYTEDQFEDDYWWDW